MAQFKDFLPNQKGWIHELARAEIHPDAERLLQLGNSFDPQQLIEESAIEFLTELRECMTQYAQVLNSFAEGGVRFAEVKIYSVAQSPADFMIFRNQVKLIFSNASQGMITVLFARHLQGVFAGENAGQSMEKPEEIIARLGPFRDVYWMYQGEKVLPEQVAKYYFSEFVRVTRNQTKSKSSNERLVQQIKALLEEKGLDF